LLVAALVREIKEELGVDLIQLDSEGQINSVHLLGGATTPDFNPYRFQNSFFKIVVKREIPFVVNREEVSSAEWITPQNFLSKFRLGATLMVPPIVRAIEMLAKDINTTEFGNLNFYHKDDEVPHIESLFGVKQILPLSNTFPPIKRTNAYLIGDKSGKVLIDPSPENELELKKFTSVVKRLGFDAILITHSHSDHWEFSNEIARTHDCEIMLSQDTFNRIKQRGGDDYFKGVSVRFVKEKDVVCKSLGLDVVVFEIPGHDEGQIALAPLDLKWFLVGDLIQTVGTVVVGAPEGDMDKYIGSLERVISLSPKFILPSHGIITGGVDKVSQTLKHRLEREQEVRDLMSQGQNVDEMLAVIYEGYDKSLLKYARKNIEAHIVRLKKTR